MTAVTIADLNNAKLDVDHIDRVATSPASTSTDRLGHIIPTVAAAVASIAAFNSRGAWAPLTAYAQKDLVLQGGVWYVSVLAHTSSAAFATDEPTKWRVHQGVTEADLQVADYTALRAYTGNAKTITVTGYLVTAAPSGIAGQFTRDDTDTTTADNGGTVIVASNARRWKRRTTGPNLDVQWFGVSPNSASDQSAAIQAAENAALAIGNANGGRYPCLSFPAGDFRCNTLTWKKVASWIGPEVEAARLVYNGPDNTAGSYIVGIEAGAGAVPWAGFYNLSFIGFESTSTANPACAHGILNLGTTLDWGFKLQNLHFANFFDDAAQLRGISSVFVNLFMHRIRWDGVGGFGVYLGSNSVNSGSPFVLDDFTMDNNMVANYITKMTAQGRYDGARWGKGVLRIEDGQGIGVAVGKARVELNKKLIPHNGGVALFYSNQTVANTRCLLHIENIQGTGRPDQPLLIARDVTGRTDFSWGEVGMSSYAKLFEDPTKPERDLYRNQVGRGSIGSIVTQQLGITVYGHSTEWRPNAPEQIAGNFASYKFGDIVWNTTPGAGRPIGWKCMSPTTGFALANGNNVTTTAVVTAASQVVPVSANLLSNLAVGLNITLVGAGVAGADLLTRITAADEVANTITVATAPSTSVAACTIKNTPAAFAPFAYLPGVSTDRGNNNVTLNLGVDAPTQYFNTPLSAAKTVTLATSASSLGTVAQAWGRFRVVRTAASTGAFTLDIAHNGGTKSLAVGQWAEFEFNGTAWILTAAGSL